MYSDCNTGRKTSLYCNRHGKSCYSCNVVRYSRGRCNHCMFPRSERGSDWKQFGKRSDMSRGELSDEGDTPPSESIHLSPNFVTTCPLFNVNFLRGPHSPIAPSPRSSRLSSGCYSLDADSGQMTKPIGCDKSTQTPSPACQAIHHAQHALAQLQRLQNRGEERIHPEISVQERAELIPMDVPPEVWIGRELRRIADDFTVYHQTGRGNAILGGGGRLSVRHPFG
ncbi:uncharacterized protein LOC127574873 isoform X2 [Pristis pectinata]|uniref:uncharacterized protein LOC127574873 isoform X2 n=1 Tax=Pristis pectinata TaxID=685728 RepID=UPI00223D329F|nr:uncharacterized protein LOC127574873 isoform X2 [Pristis pectinata]